MVQPRQGRPFGVYIHFPYCQHRCPYCDFNLKVVRQIPHEAYADAVIAELEARAERFKGRGLVSIYFGGGTPGLWEPACIERVVDAVRQRWSLLNDPADVALAVELGEEPLEVTVEINPRRAPLELLEALRGAGANRLSVGVQSFDAGVLKRLGRDHDVLQAQRTLEAARDAGWRRLSFDLLFGGPGQSPASLAEDLEEAARWASVADHVSAYSLIVEPGTLFGRMAREGRLRAAPEDDVVEMLSMTERGLAEAGWRRYEVSSYARPGREARHNSLYWTGGENMGLGVGAHEFAILEGGRALRREGARRIKDYLADPVGSAQDEESLTDEVHLSERAYLGLRTRFGLDMESVAAQFGVAAADGLREKLVELEAEGYVTHREGTAPGEPGAQGPGPAYLWPQGERWLPTAKGLLFADDLSVALL